MFEDFIKIAKSELPKIIAKGEMLVSTLFESIKITLEEATNIKISLKESIIISNVKAEIVTFIKTTPNSIFHIVVLDKNDEIITGVIIRNTIEKIKHTYIIKVNNNLTKFECEKIINGMLLLDKKQKVTKI